MHFVKLGSFFFAHMMKTKAGSFIKDALAALKSDGQLFDIHNLYPQESVQLTRASWDVFSFHMCVAIQMSTCASIVRS